MAKSKAPFSSRNRLAPATSAGAVAARAESHAPKKKRTPPLQFFREVRAEVRKITWPSRRETWITSVLVLIMVFITAIFFWVVDLGLSQAIQFILRIPTFFS